MLAVSRHTADGTRLALLLQASTAHADKQVMLRLTWVGHQLQLPAAADALAGVAMMLMHLEHCGTQNRWHTWKPIPLPDRPANTSIEHEDCGLFKPAALYD